MKKLLRHLPIAFTLCLCQAMYSQNIEILDIERISDQNIILPEDCSPEDLLVVINSAIQELRFESNMLPNTAFKVLHFPEINQYIICHEKIRFKLTVSGPDLQSEDIDIFDLDENRVYRLTANIYQGTVNFNTTPPNTTIVFPSLGHQSFSSEQPFINNPGTYPVIITKQQYRSIDTVITVPRNDTMDYSFTLEPTFAQIKLNITTEDNAAFARTPILWIDDRRITLDSRPGVVRRFVDDIAEFQLYENNIIPLPEGNYRIRVEADNYLPFETSVFAERAKVREVPIIMELIYGFITFIDSIEIAEGAGVFINNQYAGDVPLFRSKARVGSNTVRFEKPGYMTPRSEYYIDVYENENTDFYVNMRVSRRLTFLSKPLSAEVILNNNRIGFTPVTTSIPAGNHKLMLRRVGYSPIIFDLLDNPAARPEDTLQFTLYENLPLSLTSEGKGLQAHFKGLGELKNIDIANPNKVPSDILLPYGNYQIKTTDQVGRVTYRGLFNHSPDKRSRKIPSYSRTSWTTLTGDYIDEQNFEASFGRIHIFSGTGLSTSIVNAHYFVAEGPDFLSTETTTEGVITNSVDSIKYESIIAHPFFLNWDWRLGGSILRQLDICLLGRARWTPGLEFTNVNLFDFHDASMLTYFYGIEISTRLSVFNLNVKIGQQVMQGEINVWNKDQGEYTNFFDINENNFIVSFGFTLNGRVSGSNNMLRIWRKPIVHQVIDRFF